MENTSKTLTATLSELLTGFKQSDTVTISDLSSHLAGDLECIYEPYLPYGKHLQVTTVLQKNRLHSATCKLVDDNV